MLLIAAAASQMRGTRFVHADARAGAVTAAATEQPQSEGLGVAVAREAAALDGIPQQDVEFEKALPEGESLLDRDERDDLLPDDLRSTQASDAGLATDAALDCRYATTACPFICNGSDWGLVNEDLPETEVGKVRTAA